MSKNKKQFAFTRMVGRLLSFATAMELDITMRECQRFPERQKKLVAQGFSQTYNSKHLDSLAVDLILFEDGEPVWDANHPDYIALGEYWENMGGIWGGRWVHLHDAVHFEYNE
jgi:hypothetical protein